MPSDPAADPAPVPLGAKVAVIAPAGPVRPERLKRGCELLRGLGLEPVLGRHLLGPVRGYLAAEDAQRAADLEEAWADPDIRAVLCAHGGYGSVRLLDILDWERLSQVAAGNPLQVEGSVGYAVHVVVVGDDEDCGAVVGVPAQ